LLGQDDGAGAWAWLGRAKATTPKATATVRIERFTEVSRMQWFGGSPCACRQQSGR